MLGELVCCTEWHDGHNYFQMTHNVHLSRFQYYSDRLSSCAYRSILLVGLTTPTSPLFEAQERVPPREPQTSVHVRDNVGLVAVGRHRSDVKPMRLAL